MIDLTGDISIPFLKKSRFTGSFCGMRYMLRKQERTVRKEDGEETEMTVLEAVIWPEPMNFECTAEEKKHGKDFPFHATGLQEAIAWLNQEYEAHHF